jgi:hypothetical protein
MAFLVINLVAESDCSQNFNKSSPMAGYIFWYQRHSWRMHFLNSLTSGSLLPSTYFSFWSCHVYPTGIGIIAVKNIQNCRGMYVILHSSVLISRFFYQNVLTDFRDCLYNAREGGGRGRGDRALFCTNMFRGFLLIRLKGIQKRIASRQIDNTVKRGIV